MTDWLVILNGHPKLSSDNALMPRPNLPIRQHLEGVSRSFGLSIRLLPPTLQQPVGLAYLLARLSDTVADATDVPSPRRLALLDSLRHAIDTPQDHPQMGLALQDFARQVADRHEQRLLHHGQALLHALDTLPAADQAVIRQVLCAILEGQRWDLQALDGPQHGAQTRADIERYTWQVAGSVGEFWTRMCELHLSDWHTVPPAQTAQLLHWGARYGQGLQRLNILRDAGRDLQAGRCYFPDEELHPLGLDSAQLCQAAQHGDMAVLERLRPLLAAWLHTTQEQLHDGLRYSLALQGRRLRLASALPCLIGIRTLALLRQAGPQALLTHVKLPRREVQKLLLRLLVWGVSDRQLQGCWAQAAPAPARIQP
jgi:farnesyl-diphosphate farnesyltransferase